MQYLQYVYHKNQKGRRGTNADPLSSGPFTLLHIFLEWYISICIVGRSLPFVQQTEEEKDNLSIVKDSAQVNLLRHHLNTGISSNDDLRGHVDEKTVVHDTGDSLELTIHRSRIINSTLNS